MARSVTDWIDLKRPAGWVTSLLTALVILAVMYNPSTADCVLWCDVIGVEDDGATFRPDKQALMRGGFFDAHLQRSNWGLFSVFDFDWEGQQARILGVAGQFHVLWIRESGGEDTEPQPGDHVAEVGCDRLACSEVARWSHVLVREGSPSTKRNLQPCRSPASLSAATGPSVTWS